MGQTVVDVGHGIGPRARRGRRSNRTRAGRGTHLIALLIGLGLLLGNLGAAIAAAPAVSPDASGSARVLVRFWSDPGPTAPELLGQLLTVEPTEVTPLGIAGLYRVDLASGSDALEALTQLRRSPLVRYAELDRLLAPSPSPTRLQTGTAPPNDWGLDKIGAREAWQWTEGEGVVVAVLDTGVRADHPDLAGRVLPGWNFVADNANATDDAGHGTYVAGIIAAARTGVVSGVAPAASILPVKILDENAVGSTANFVAGIIYAVDHGAQVINISASGIVDSQALYDAVAYAEAHNVVVVAAAGNEPDGEWNYPAAVPQVLAVSASTQDDTVASFSSYGAFVDLAAPGVDIGSTWWSPGEGNGYRNGTGTTAAAPFVAGTAALVLSQQPGLSAAEVRQILLETAVDIDAPGIDPRSGHGRLDAAAATRLTRAIDAPAPGTIERAPSGEGGIAADELRFQAGTFQPGEAVHAWVTTAEGKHQLIRGLTADSTGSLTATLGPISAFPTGYLTVTAVSDSGATAQATHLVYPEPVHPAFQPVTPVESTPDRLYFPETGHTLAYGFKEFWEANGGLAVFGYPISEEFTEVNPDTGLEHTVQYFERNRFEYHPELAGTPYEVSLGRLGAEFAPQQFPTAPPTTASAQRDYYPETGHTLGGTFRDAWHANGGLTIFGYPISEPFESGGVLVQYFERARFEEHPDLDPAHRVLLTRLGVELARQRGYLD